jgi:hypothetical protein
MPWSGGASQSPSINTTTTTLKCESEPAPASPSALAAALQWRAWPTSSLAPLVLPAWRLVGAGQSVSSLPTTPGCGKERKSHSTTALGPGSARLHDAALVKTCIRYTPWSAALAAHQTATCRTRDRNTTPPPPPPPEPGHCWPGLLAPPASDQRQASRCRCRCPCPSCQLLAVLGTLGHTLPTRTMPPTVANMPVALDTLDSLLTRPPSAHLMIHEARRVDGNASPRTCLLAHLPLDPVNHTSSLLPCP